MRLDGADEPLRVAVLAQHRRAVLRVLVEGRMPLVVEVVQQGDVAPGLLVLAELAGVRAHRRLDAQRVAAAAPRSSSTRSAAPRPRRGRVRGRPPSAGEDSIPQAGPVGAGSESGYPVEMAIATRAGTVESLLIEGGAPLSGTVRPAGNKNAALPILAACLLTADPVTLENVPRIRDVEEMLELIAALGVEVEWLGRRTRCASGPPTSPAPSSTRSCASGSAPRSCSPARCWRASAPPTCRRPAAT